MRFYYSFRNTKNGVIIHDFFFIPFILYIEMM